MRPSLCHYGCEIDARISLATDGNIRRNCRDGREGKGGKSPGKLKIKLTC